MAGVAARRGGGAGGAGGGPTQATPPADPLPRGAAPLTPGHAGAQFHGGSSGESHLVTLRAPEHTHGPLQS